MADKIIKFLEDLQAWFKLIMAEIEKAIKGANDHDKTLEIEDEAE